MDQINWTRMVKHGTNISVKRTTSIGFHWSKEQTMEMFRQRAMDNRIHRDFKIEA